MPTPSRKFDERYNAADAEATALEGYNTAMKQADASYDNLMKQIDASDAQAYGDARKMYEGNTKRAQMMHNAQLLGDLAHLGVQTWSAKPGTMGSAGSNSVFAPIKPTDKYLEQGEAWRQKMSQSYLDEVMNRNKRQREDALRRLNSDTQRATDARNFAYRADQDALTRQHQKEADEENRRRWEEQQQFSREQFEETKKRNKNAQALQWAQLNDQRDYRQKQLDIQEMRAKAALEKSRNTSYTRGSNHDIWKDHEGNVYDVDYNKINIGAIDSIYEALGGDKNNLYGTEQQKRNDQIRFIRNALENYPEYGVVLKDYEKAGAIVNRGKDIRADEDGTPKEGAQTDWSAYMKGNNAGAGGGTDWSQYIRK